MQNSEQLWYCKILCFTDFHIRRSAEGYEKWQSIQVYIFRIFFGAAGLPTWPAAGRCELALSVFWADGDKTALVWKSKFLWVGTLHMP